MEQESFSLSIHAKYLKLPLFLDLADEELNEDDVLALESIAEARRNNEEFLRISFTIALKENLMSVIQIIKIIEVSMFGKFIAKL